jgi:hypothetical protein
LASHLEAVQLHSHQQALQYHARAIGYQAVQRQINLSNKKPLGKFVKLLTKDRMAVNFAKLAELLRRP